MDENWGYHRISGNLHVGPHLVVMHWIIPRPSQGLGLMSQRDLFQMLAEVKHNGRDIETNPWKPLPFRETYVLCEGGQWKSWRWSRTIFAVDPGAFGFWPGIQRWRDGSKRAPKWIVYSVWFCRKWGYPNSWMVYFMENSIYKWMINMKTGIKKWATWAVNHHR